MRRKIGCAIWRRSGRDRVSFRTRLHTLTVSNQRFPKCLRKLGSAYLHFLCNDRRTFSSLVLSSHRNFSGRMVSSQSISPVTAAHLQLHIFSVKTPILTPILVFTTEPKCQHLSVLKQEKFGDQPDNSLCVIADQRASVSPHARGCSSAAQATASLFH